MKENFKPSLKLVLDDEDGYSDDPNDRGGETNFGAKKFGISKKSHPDEDIKNMTPERAGEIYLLEYWTPVRCDELPSGVDYVVFDSAVQHGSINAGRFLQRASNRQIGTLITDGIIGDLTIRNVTRCEPRGLICDILRERNIFYHKIVAQDHKQERFFKGWLSRLDRVAVNVKEFK
jgi:lysozyme family protein